MDQAKNQWVGKTLAAMTLEEKVGQLIVPGFRAGFFGKASPQFQQIERNIRQFHVGGYHVFPELEPLSAASGSAVRIDGNLSGAALLLTEMQKMSKVPLLITADFEGGLGYRFAGATLLPRGMALGATRNPDLAYQAGKITATEGRLAGVHVNFYPVVDVNNNPRNPIINIRSFGEDVELVSKMARAYIRGSQDNGMVATAKHFPGHGDTASDSHLGLPVLDLDRKRLDQVELPPFQAAIDEGVMAVMSAHIALPRVAREKERPATLSPSILTGLLRNELKFKGLIYTDAMDMFGISKNFPNDRAPVLAVQAGADVVLIPPDTEAAFHGILAAVKSGEVSMERLDTSVRRILQTKAELDLEHTASPQLSKLVEGIGGADNQKIAREMIEQAVTLVRDERNVLPLKLPRAASVLYVNILDEPNPAEARGAAFLAELKRRYDNVTYFECNTQTSPDAVNLILDTAFKYDAALTTAFIRVAAYKGNIDLTDSQMKLLRRFSASPKAFIFVLLGSPYLLSQIPELPSYILTYDFNPEAERASVRCILGELKFRGKLPVSLPGLYPVGHGLER